MSLGDLFATGHTASPVSIVAEAGVNHNGDLGLALALVDEAAGAGADAVKFQAFVPSRMAIRGAAKAAYQQSSGPCDEDQFEMLARLQLSPGDFRVLQRKAKERGLLFLASVFDEESAAALHDLGVTVFKIPSGELTNLPLIRAVASYQKPTIVSTGMATLGEVEEAIDAARQAGNEQLVLLHCVSSYPAPDEALNLRALRTLREAFALPVGFSDHSQGTEAAVAAVALGAAVIEKHLTLDKNLAGPDHRASLAPAEFRRLVESVRRVEKALGSGRKTVTAAEQELRTIARKSIVAGVEIRKDTVITREMVELKRPATGLAPSFLPSVLGRRAARDISADENISWPDLA